MDGTRIADVGDLSTDDTFLFRVRSVDDNAVASGDAALRSDERTAEAADADEPDADVEPDGGETSGAATNDDGIAMPDDMQDDDDDVREAILLRLGGEDDDAGAVVCWLNYCQHMIFRIY